MLGELKHGELKPRGLPQACYSSQAACETGDRLWDIARSALAEGSCLQRGKLCSWPVHCSPRGGSAAGPALLSVALDWRLAELALLLSPSKGKSSLQALPGLSSAGEDEMLEDKPMEKRGTYREIISSGTPASVQNSWTNASPLLANVTYDRGLCPTRYGLQQAVCTKGDCQYQHLVPLATFIPLIWHQ